MVAIITLFLGTNVGAQQSVRYNRHVRPIFADRCFKCHGRDEKNRQAELRLDVREEAIKLAIVPGQADQSELISRLSADGDERMPPVDSHKRPLDQQQIKILRQWINEGALYEPHWAFVPPVRPVLPRVEDASWVRNSLDRFVLARLENKGLRPSPEADRHTLIRRVSLDLTGLPPTPNEVEEFVNDDSSRAYERVVDRLLQSKYYGEHLARHWLDAARYADTNGYQYDLERDQWVWRDWVIHAFNMNMPFDQFTIEQLAGDLLPDATDQQNLATAFNRNHPITIEGGVIDEEYRTEYVVDRVVTTSTVWLGLTMLCSRCHDHKYDPISQREFYQFFAFFNQVPEQGIRAFDPRRKIVSPLRDEQLATLDEQIAVAAQQYQRLLDENSRSLVDWEQQIITAMGGVWTVMVPEEMNSEEDTELSVLSDQSILASGNNPESDTYEIFVRTNASTIRAIRLEILNDPSMTNGSVGRAANGNFVLSEFQLYYAPAGRRDQFNRLQSVSAEANYSQQHYDIALAIDDKVDQKGWAVDGNQTDGPYLAVFNLGDVNGFPEGTLLRINMLQRYGRSHQIGRFRLALAVDEQHPVPLDIQVLLGLPVEQRNLQQRERLNAYLVERIGSPDIRGALADVKRLRKQRAQLEDYPHTMVMVDKQDPRTTHVLYRGEYDKPRESVTSGVPSIFPPLPEHAPRNRFGLAQWLVMPDNPLTARVTVNRFWQRLFGTGVVDTIEDFGTQGAWPSHPDLLDWLAVDFVESGWDVKALHKLLVMSATYRQASTLEEAADISYSMIPKSQWLSCGPRLRLDAEMIRDSALMVSGLLVKNIGGPSVFPYHPQGLWQEINNRPGLSRVYQKDHGTGLYRRSLYTFWKRTVPPPAMAAFDAPNREYCVVRRSRTNTPLQAYVLLHDPQFVEAARHLARRMMMEGGSTQHDRISYGFLLCTARLPNNDELDVLQQMLEGRITRYSSDREAAERLLAIGDSPRDELLNVVEHAAYTTVARMLLNLSEFITKS